MMKCHGRRRRKLSLFESFPCIVWVRVLEAYPSSPSLVFSSRLFWPSQTVCLWLVKNCTAIIPVNKMGRWVDRYTRKCVRQGSTWSDSKVHELIAVKVLRTSLLNTTVVAFKVLPLGSYALMPVPSPPFKTILELVLWNGFQSCRCITPDVIKMPSFQYFLYLREQKKVIGD